ncbi:MAG: cyanophycinase [Verrucomicrobia bacterium]|nr:cyanophycinase [Verrucomicrobiota bacterium]
MNLLLAVKASLSRQLSFSARAATGVLMAAMLMSTGCRNLQHASTQAGHLLIIGGGLDNDLRPVFERFLALASKPGAARIVIATTAITSVKDRSDEEIDKTEALRAWAPEVPVDLIRRSHSTAQTVAAFDRATGIFFTGGKQESIAVRYRPGGRETPEWLALKRLLGRGGVIAGGSAGTAMMGERMLLDGGNADSLNDTSRPGQVPRMGQGMAFLPWAITDSHFFERDRVARLVVALENSGRRLGLGVGEDAAVEVDLASGVITGVTGSDSLLIDMAAMKRSGQTRSNVWARLIRQGDRLSLPKRLHSALPAAAAQPAGPINVVCFAFPGQNRQLGLWRVFMGASRPGSGAWRSRFEGWRIVAWPDGRGEVIFEVSPAP